jgi:hypothetical protein
MMTKAADEKKRTPRRSAKHREVPEPVNVIEDMPDVAAGRPLWFYVLLAAVFVAWLGVLIYVHVGL